MKSNPYLLRRKDGGGYWTGGTIVDYVRDPRRAATFSEAEALDGESRFSGLEAVCFDWAFADFDKKRKRNAARKEREQAMKDCGLVKAKGALGGTYWE